MLVCKSKTIWRDIKLNKQQLIDRYKFYIGNLEKCIRENPQLKDVEVEAWDSRRRTYLNVIEDLESLEQ